MKRPVGIYFVMVWLVMATSALIQPLNRIAEQFKEKNLEIPDYLTAAIGGSIVLLIFILVGLFNLENLNRWMAIGVFSIASLLSIFSFFAIGGLKKIAPLSFLILRVGIVLNILCIFYLTSSRFVKRSEEFRKEKAKNRFMLKGK